MNRLPIRLRLTLAYTLALAIVLAATGAFLYARLGSSLDETIDESLHARSAELASLLERDGGQTGQLAAPATADADERIVQVLEADGTLVEGRPPADAAPLLAPDQAERAARGEIGLELQELDGVGGRVRLLAAPVSGGDRNLVLVVGTSIEDRDETLDRFIAWLVGVGAAALLLLSLLGYALASAALRPVASMQGEADAISASEPGRRLTLPRARDEVYRLGETLNRMLGRLEGALERERGFVADASHELRTPLANLKTELDLALRRPRSEAELVGALRSAAEETDRLARLAEDLLLLARSDEGALTLRRERISARDLLERVATRFARRAEAANRTVQVETQGSAALSCDPVRLEQALANLVENALQHGEGAVELAAVERDDLVELHVRDEGRGFPPEFLPRAFDRFSRADAARSGEGAGLGLPIVATIAAAHGGSAHAANREEGGADAWLAIPRA